MEYLENRKVILEEKKREDIIRRKKYGLQLKKLKYDFFDYTIKNILEEYRVKGILNYNSELTEKGAKADIYLTEDNQEKMNSKHILYFDVIGDVNEKINATIKLEEFNQGEEVEVQINALTETPENFKKILNNLFEKLDDINSWNI